MYRRLCQVRATQVNLSPEMLETLVKPIQTDGGHVAVYRDKRKHKGMSDTCANAYIMYTIRGNRESRKQFKHGTFVDVGVASAAARWLARQPSCILEKRTTSSSTATCAYIESTLLARCTNECDKERYIRPTGSIECAVDVADRTTRPSDVVEVREEVAEEVLMGADADVRVDHTVARDALDQLKADDDRVLVPIMNALEATDGSIFGKNVLSSFTLNAAQQQGVEAAGVGGDGVGVTTNADVATWLYEDHGRKVDVKSLAILLTTVRNEAGVSDSRRVTLYMKATASEPRRKYLFQVWTPEERALVAAHMRRFGSAVLKGSQKRKRDAELHEALNSRSLGKDRASTDVLVEAEDDQDASAVTTWLRARRLVQYNDALVAIGVESIQDLGELLDEDLQQMGMKTLHIRRFRA